MKTGIVGLGKMGGNMARRLASKGYDILAYDASGAAVKEAKPFKSLDGMVSALGTGTVILSVPHGAVDDVLSKLTGVLGKGSVVIDTGNSFYKDTVRRGAELKKHGIDFIDAGCSGGPSGALNGLSIMVGGDRKAFEKSEKLFRDLSTENGYAYFGPSGAGHFVKMVHNAIEYGMMQSIGEGFDLLANGPYQLDLKTISDVWQNGSVVRSYLMELSSRAFSNDGKLDKIKGYVEDSGEGRWSVNAAIEHNVPFTALAHSLFARFRSRREPFSDKLLAALRHEFGGHDVKKK